MIFARCDTGAFVRERERPKEMTTPSSIPASHLFGCADPLPPSCVQVPHRGVRNQGLLDSCAGGRGRLRRARAASLCRHCQPCQPQQLSPHPTPHSGRRFNMKSDRSDGSHPTANSTANPRQFTANQRKTTSSNSPINANQRKFSANRRKPTPFGRQQTPANAI